MHVGRYRLVRPLGTGGMGAVWLAHDPALGVPLALKWLSAEGPYAWLIEAEGRAAAALDHPNVVRVFDAGRLDADVPEALEDLGLRPAAPWFAMELLPHGLGQVTSWEGLRTTLAGVLSGLAHAHAHGLVHCDLKPDNVLRRSSGEPVITDFGVARSLRPAGRLAPGGGTPCWAAPEQLDAEEWRIGPWTDLYAVGLLAWLLASGEPLLGGDLTVPEVREAQRAAIGATLHLNFPVPTGFTAWVARMTAADARARYRHAATALRDLDPTDPPPPLPAPTTPSTTRPDARYGVGILRYRTVPLVGREAAVNLVWRELQRVLEGTTRVVAVDGAAGTGKSALGRWLVARVNELGLAAGFSTALAGGGDPAAALLADALGRLRGADPLGPALAAAGLPAPGTLAAVLETSGDGEVVSNVSAARRVAAAVAHLSEGRPAVVWLDDADRAPVRALVAAMLAERHPMLILLTQRSPEPLVDGCTRISLDPLAPEALADLVDALAPLEAAVRERIGELAQGLPLFAIELAIDCLDRGILQWDRDGWRLKPGVQMPVPAPLASVWLARVNRAFRNQPEVLDWLGVAGLLGHEVPVDVWREVGTASGLGPMPRDLIPTLQASGLGSVLPDHPVRMRFAHALLADVLAEAVADPAPIHRDAADAYARRGGSERERASHHRWAAGDTEGAMDDLVEAALYWKRNDFAVAAQMLDRVLAHATTPRIRGLAAFRRADIALGLGAADEAVRIAMAALRGLDEARDGETAALLWAELASAYVHLDDPAESARCGARAEALLPGVPALTQWRVLARLGINVSDTDPERGIALLDAAVACAPTLDLAAEARMIRAGIFGADPERADEGLRELAYVRETMVTPQNLMRSAMWHWMRVLIFVGSSRWDEATPDAVAALRIRLRMGSVPASWIGDIVTKLIGARRIELARIVVAEIVGDPAETDTGLLCRAVLARAEGRTEDEEGLVARVGAGARHDVLLVPLWAYLDGRA